MQTQYRKKPVVITAITFAQLVAHGIAQCKAEGCESNIVDGMPWSFSYNGHPITHENNDCYIIPTLEGHMFMGRTDMLITGVKGEIYPCKGDIFQATYEVAGEDDAIEQQIVQAGADTAPRVTPADIDALMARVVVTYEHRPNGSTLTFAHALLDGEFYLASGFSACVSSANYNAEIGQQVATDKAMRSARDKLWELEGYRLRRLLAGDQQCPARA